MEVARAQAQLVGTMLLEHYLGVGWLVCLSFFKFPVFCLFFIFTFSRRKVPCFYNIHSLIWTLPHASRLLRIWISCWEFPWFTTIHYLFSVSCMQLNFKGLGLIYKSCRTNWLVQNLVHLIANVAFFLWILLMCALRAHINFHF